MPHQFTKAMEDELRQHLSAEHVEWIALAVGMMGFLNKFMDAMGVELEQKAVDDVADLIGPTGWEIGAPHACWMVARVA